MSADTVVRSLYRRALRILATVIYVDGAEIAAARWAEFIAPCVMVKQKNNLRMIVRESFDMTPISAVAISNGFDFLKQATASLFTIEVCALWQKITSSEERDFLCGMGLMTAAFDMAGTEDASKVRVRVRANHFSVSMEQLIQKITTTLMRKANVEYNFKCTKKVLYQVHKNALRLVNIPRSESRPEDFTALSLVSGEGCSEYVLNIILFIVLRNMGFVCSLVGAGLHFRWIRVNLSRPDCNGDGRIKPLFVSWSYGVKERREVESLIAILDTQWFKRVPWDDKAMRSVFYELLHQQLSCASGAFQDPTIIQAKRSICKEQLIFLLSLQYDVFKA